MCMRQVNYVMEVVYEQDKLCDEICMHRVNYMRKDVYEQGKLCDDRCVCAR